MTNLARGIEHKITCSYYMGPVKPYLQTMMECSCGWSTSRCACWEDAGREMDRHIEENNAHEGLQAEK